MAVRPCREGTSAAVPLLALLLAAACPRASGPSIAATTSAEPSARGCAACHAREVRDWAGSRHQLSYDNAIFARGYQRDPVPRCIHCHLPLPAQREELANGGAGGLVHEGITCLACHATPHRKPSDEDDSNTTSCAACHEFRFHGRAELAQATVSEWRDYQSAGGRETCVSCHMPAGTHAFPGPHDSAFLRRSLGIELSATERVEELRLTNRVAGHGFPTGDTFRELRVEGRPSGREGFVPIATIGRNPCFSSAGGGVIRWRNDNALRPLETRVVSVRAGEYAALRVVYAFEGGLPPLDALPAEQLAHVVLYTTEGHGEVDSGTCEPVARCR